MKQIVLILSFIIAAFLAACSESPTTTGLKSNGGIGEKSLDQLEKASSDQSLEALKAELEVNPNLQVPDIIQRVKYKFGTVKRVVKDVPSQEDQKSPRRLEKVIKQESDDIEDQAEEDLLNIESLEVESEAAKVQTAVNGNTEKKTVCIKTCKTQIIVEKEFDSTKKLSAVKAFVVVALDKENIEYSSSEKNEKKLESITAYYSAKSASMILKFNVSQKSGKALDLTTKAFAYGKNIYSGEFSQVSTGQKGEYSIAVENKKKYLALTFNNQDNVVSELTDDLGLFGRNINAEVETEAKVLPENTKSESGKTDAKTKQAKPKATGRRF